jgi:hypothetical protein
MYHLKAVFIFISIVVLEVLYIGETGEEERYGK